jgi:hypothetical protein
MMEERLLARTVQISEADVLTFFRVRTQAMLSSYELPAGRN